MVIHRMIDNITVFFIKRNIIESDMKDIFVYGMELMLSTLLEVFNVIMLGIIMHCLWQSVIYLIAMMTIRTYTGGYHANTHFRCNIMFLLTFIASHVIVQALLKISISSVLIWVAVVIAYLIVICEAPVINHNKILNIYEKNRNKIISCIIYSALVILLIGCDIYGYSYEKSVYIGSFFYKYSLYIKEVMIIIAIFMLVGKYKEKYYYDSIDLLEKGR